MLQQLSHSPKTRLQLRNVLQRRNVPAAAAEAALDRISELGYIDDVAFARSWVEARHFGKGLAERVVQRELHQRGISSEICEQVLSVIDSDTERVAASALVAKRLRSLSGVEPAAKTRRLVSMLGRKGYSGGMAYQVVREALQHDFEIGAEHES